MLTPLRVPADVKVDLQYYMGQILGADTCPKIRNDASEVPSARWAFMRDLASPHTEHETFAYLEREKARSIPRSPKGAVVNSLDATLWGGIRKELRKLPLPGRDTRAKLRTALTQIIAGLRVDDH